jgi:hypothetical protein
MSQMRDLPPIAGAIIWARQIEPQLLTYVECVKDVPGKGWELYAKGQKLQSDSAAFRKKTRHETSLRCMATRYQPPGYGHQRPFIQDCLSSWWGFSISCELYFVVSTKSPQTPQNPSTAPSSPNQQWCLHQGYKGDPANAPSR